MLLDSFSLVIMQVLKNMLTAREHVLINECDSMQYWEPALFVQKTWHKKININIYRDFIEFLTKQCCEHGILLYIEDVTSNVKELVQSTASPQVELFSAAELAFDITKHVLQPQKFIPLTSAQQAAIKEKYGTVGLPRILARDPIVRYYNWPRGKIIQVINDNQSHYRIVH